MTSSTWMSSALSSSRQVRAAATSASTRSGAAWGRRGAGALSPAGPAADRALVLVAAARRGRRGAAAGASASCSPARAFGVRAMGASCFSSFVDPTTGRSGARGARMAVADAGCSGAGIRHQGACAPGAPSEQRSRAPAVASQDPRRLPGEGPPRGAGARHHGDRRCPGDLPPAAPARQLVQVVGAEQQREAGAREAAPEQRQGVGGVARAELRFDAGRDHAAAVGHAPGRGEARREGRHAAGRLQRVAGRDQEPDLVEAERCQGPLRHVPVPFMGRVEAAAEQADAGAAPIAAGPGGFIRHLTWTLTVTGCGARPS